MLLNLSTLRTELKQRLKNLAISNTRLDQWLNMGQDEVASEMDPDHLIFTTALSTVANTRKYYINVEFNKILAIMDTGREWVLHERPIPEIEEIDPDFSDTGNPEYYSVYGLEFVEAQPTSASVITTVSSSASDTTQTLRINGTVSGVDDTELLTFNGTTNVVGTKSFSAVHSLIKSATTTGRITTTSNSGAVTLATIAPSSLGVERQPIYFYPVPSGVNTLSIRGIRKPRPLLNTEDIPDFPTTYHELVLIAATIRGHDDLFRPTVAREVRQREWEPMVNKLKKQMGNKRGKTSPVIGGRTPVHYGGRYPSNFSHW